MLAAGPTTFFFSPFHFQRLWKKINEINQDWGVGVEEELGKGGDDVACEGQGPCGSRLEKSDTLTFLWLLAPWKGLKAATRPPT